MTMISDLYVLQHKRTYLFHKMEFFFQILQPFIEKPGNFFLFYLQGGFSE